MKVIRKAKYKIENNDIQVGDKIKIYLKDLDEDFDFTLTAQEVSKDGNGAWFLFDDPVCRRPREGLEEWLNNDFLEMFPKKWRERIKAVTIPSYEQIFGHGELGKEDEIEWYEKHIIPTNDESFSRMLLRKNRLKFDENDQLCWWWLRNACKDIEEDPASSAFFAGVSYNGNANCNNASNSDCVVPLLLISNQSSDRNNNYHSCNHKALYGKSTVNGIPVYIAYATYADASEVLNAMLQTIESYGEATISDLYELSQITNGDYKNNTIGWTDLTDAKIRKGPCRESYILELPSPKTIE